MHFPFILSSHKRLVVAQDGWFDSIGKLDLDSREVEVGISRLGEKGLAWILDAHGQFFALEWRGKTPRSLLQLLGLVRQRELYSIGEPRQVTAGELLSLIADHNEQFEEAPNTAGFRRNLHAVSPSMVLGREIMRNYLGE